MKPRFVTKNNISRLPKSAGVYTFKSKKKVLYIGKARNLKDRVKNHFQQPAFRDNLFVNQVEKIGFIKTDSDIEALILEAKLIKRYKPKYNIVWRDDKNYFYVGITKEKFPTVLSPTNPDAYLVFCILYLVLKIKKYEILNTIYKIQSLSALLWKDEH